MDSAMQKKAAAEFAAKWQGIGDEKQHSQKFWIELLQKVYGVEDPAGFVDFEKKVQLGHASFVDITIPATHVIIEQKSLGKDLTKPIRQSDGTYLTPYQQAKRYAAEFSYSERPRWIVACNFQEFHIYDMENPQMKPEVLRLEDLPKEYYRLQFLVSVQDHNIQKEMELSMQAGEIVGKLYNALLDRYNNPDSEAAQQSLNKLCVRIVFLLYAEDAGILGRKNMFHDFLAATDPKHMRTDLKELFRVLDTPPEQRDPYLEEGLAAFPYINGGLFADEEIEIPTFTQEIIELLISHASKDFDWSGISPTIFGAVFESTLNPETRRKGGMHYTSLENIHKVIDPLFLTSLKQEFEEIRAGKQPNVRKKKLGEFQDKLASLTFLDPACGSGNFLTEAYISLRRLENNVLLEMYKEKSLTLDFGEEYSFIKVSINQFYGIEINDFAVTVAKTALWIAESQMLAETEQIVNESIGFLPLKSYTNIVEGNALRLDWESVLPREKCSYIMGNPPFAGRRYRTDAQIKDVANFFNYKDIDYVACWYKKASMYIQGTSIKCAYVSTNSITQGEQVSALWEELFTEYGVTIDFAHRTFKWSSESKKQAAVFCVVIGFHAGATTGAKVLYFGGSIKECHNINGYLMDAPNVFIHINKTPICDVPKMQNGNVPLDGDALKIEETDYEKFKGCEKYIKRLIGGRELLHNELRYVLWLVGVTPTEIKKHPAIYQRVQLCRENRLAMKDKGTQKLADTPTTFRDTLNPSRYIALPMVSSERRRYIPMAYFDGDTIPTNQVQIIQNAELYHLGVLISNVHMAWMRAVAGRLKSDYRYSKDIVYNNFPWPTPTVSQKSAIEKSAQAILDARALYPDASLADLYDEVTMPPELRRAHKANDRAVMAAYGFPVKGFTEADCVAELMKMYQELAKG